ncbi:MAG: hypothetical protein EAY66_05750 [Sphingobacteriales bacterium]|jgi:hypothetical protein|nr:MAG: hypothetical protein EAY66_05750 [Sphingobacteriales bacterium]
MDNIITNEDSNAEKQPLTIDASSWAFLLETAKWGKFLSIAGFVASGLLILIALFFIFGSKGLNTSAQGLPASMGAALGYIYLILGAIYYFPSKHLYDFSFYGKQALLINDQESLTYALGKLKSVFKFWGIATIVIMAIYALILIIAIVGFMATSH